MAYTNWITRSVKAGANWTSSNITVPTGIDEVRVRLNLLNNSDFSTPDKSITLIIEISADGATNWTEIMRVGWVGGPVPTRPGVVGGWFSGLGDCGRYAGQLVRVNIVSSGSFRWGIQGEIS